MKRFKLGQEVVYKTKESDEWQVGQIHKIVVTAVLCYDDSISKAIDCYDRANKWMNPVLPVKEFVKVYKKDITEIIKDINKKACEDKGNK